METNDKEYEVNFNENIAIENFIMAINHLDPYTRYTHIKDLISKYNLLFAKDKYDVGTVKGYEAHIDLLIDKYCRKKPYRCRIEDMKEIGQQI